MANVQNLVNFKKGDPRINRKGRPKKNITTFLKEFGDGKKVSYHIELTDKDGKKKELKGVIAGKGSNGTINQLIATQLLAKAIKGDLKAIQEVLDRTEGKPKQSIELDNLFAGGTLKVGYGDQDAEQENED